MSAEIEKDDAHRPWPLPSTPWIMFQSWRELLFAHWPLPPERIRALVPEPLLLEEFDGRAWIGITPFLLTDLRARGLPAIPGVSEFPELNLRTYVRFGDKPGIFFFSLDAASGAAVIAARAFYRLPYHRAEMSIAHRDGWIEYLSRRSEGDAEFIGRYRAVGESFHAPPGTLEYFLTERYALYTVLRNGDVLRGEIHHSPWTLQNAEAKLDRNTLAAASGITLPDRPPLLHFSARQDTLIWAPELAS
jgi:uncharacterized protein YqjF (DUF2071 family)